MDKPIFLDLPDKHGLRIDGEVNAQSLLKYLKAFITLKKPRRDTFTNPHLVVPSPNGTTIAVMPINNFSPQTRDAIVARTRKFLDMEGWTTYAWLTEIYCKVVTEEEFSCDRRPELSRDPEAQEQLMIVSQTKGQPAIACQGIYTPKGAFKRFLSDDKSLSHLCGAMLVFGDGQKRH